MKRYLDISVHQAAEQRIEAAIERFPDFYVSFSGGKDSGVLMSMVIDVARRMGRLPVKAVFSDLEAIFTETERYAKSIMELAEVEPYWLCFDEIENNSSSVFERYFRIWDKSCQEKWVREMPSMPYVINDQNCPQELKKRIPSNNINGWSIKGFGEYLCDKNGVSEICNFLGVRASESYNRRINISANKHRNKANAFTYKNKDDFGRTWICQPLYDWETSDIWHYYATTGKDYNRVYDSFMKMGLPYSAMRTCYAFGDEQKKALWQWKVIEPETWDRLVARVEGANFGSLYNHTNINRNKLKKPANLTWKRYLDILVAQLPDLVRTNFEEKFKIAFRYHKIMYEDKLGIAPEVYIVDSRAEAKRKSAELNIPFKCFIEYESLCEAIIKRDFVFKKYGFGYSEKMLNRIKTIQQTK